MATPWENVLRNQIQERRQRLQSAIAGADEAPRLVTLLQEVDSALERLDGGSYGLCADCHQPIEDDRLLADPLTEFCLGCLTPAQQRALQADLELAARIQAGLLPKPRRFDGWDVSFRYEPAGPVSGDYLDLVSEDSESVLFLVGDVSGKGVAASLLMSHLHAIFRSLAGMGLPVSGLVEHANRVFCESTISTHFATLVCGRAAPSGGIEISNAGHCPPLVVHGGEVCALESTGIPIGILADAPYSCLSAHLESGDTLVLYTDGLVELEDERHGDYGAERLRQVLRANAARPPQELLAACLEDARAFRGRQAPPDDLTLLVLRRS